MRRAAEPLQVVESAGRAALARGGSGGHAGRRCRRRAFERFSTRTESERVRSCEGAAYSAWFSSGSRTRTTSSVEHAPPLRRRLVLADHVQRACRVYEDAPGGLGASAPRACPYGALHRAGSPRAAPRFRSFWKADSAGSSARRRPLDLGPPARSATTSPGRRLVQRRARLPRPRRCSPLARQRQVTLSSVVQAAWAAPAQPLQRARRTSSSAPRSPAGRPSCRASRTRRAVREQPPGARPHLPRGASRRWWRRSSIRSSRT